MQDYILVPHFYRLNWARQMSEFLMSSDGFAFAGNKPPLFGNYSKAQKTRDLYLNNLLDDVKFKEKKNLFFVNLNDYIYFSRRSELREKFNIYGFMRGSRFFDSEPGNGSFGKDQLEEMLQLEKESLLSVDGLFLGSNSFKSFLCSKIDGLNRVPTKVVGIPIFTEPRKISKNEKNKDLILWNHRLQKQKNPWVLFLLREELRRKIAICTPEALSAAYSNEMKQNEKIFYSITRDNGKRRSDYLKTLEKASFVLSFAQHETWGNSMIEGVMYGCVPIAPDGELCSYKELFPKEFIYNGSFLNKKNKTKEDIIKNIDEFSQYLLNFIKEDYTDLLTETQSFLWSRFNSANWLKNLVL